jgi:heavy metal sensor kinase
VTALTLTTRLSLFTLTMLGVVLVGFSTTLYFLASAHLYRQADERLDAAMNTLVAAVEIGPDGVEWEPAERHLNLSQGAFADQVVWTVSDDKGKQVDRSGPAADDLLPAASASQGGDQRTTGDVRWQEERWQWSRQWVRPTPGMQARPEPVQPGQANEPTKYPALTITAGMSIEPVAAVLRRLAGTLAGLSLATWLVALVLGRTISRRALRPVNHMALAARDMDADDLGQRLPSSPTGDEVEELAVSFNGLLDRLQESFERQQRFTGDASHQLRNPLAAVLGQLEVALRRQRSPEEYERVLTTVHGQALHLRRIVEALLFLARADAESRLSRTECIDLAAWLGEHLQHWSSQPRAADLHLEISCEQPLRVLAQEPLLCQLVDILIENAVKYSEPGSPITVRLGNAESTACLAVEDRGSGIAAEDLPHVFEPFYRAPEARRQGIEGLGLGLAIAKRIAVALDGRISVTSQSGHGSCFTVQLPLAAPAGGETLRSHEFSGERGR